MKFAKRQGDLMVGDIVAIAKIQPSHVSPFWGDWKIHNSFTRKKFKVVKLVYMGLNWRVYLAPIRAFHTNSDLAGVSFPVDFRLHDINLYPVNPKTGENLL